MSKLNLTRLVLGLSLSIFAFSAIGCETTEGVGKDVQKAGKGLEDAADRNK